MWRFLIEHDDISVELESRRDGEGREGSICVLAIKGRANLTVAGPALGYEQRLPLVGPVIVRLLVGDIWPEVQQAHEGGVEGT